MPRTDPKRKLSIGDIKGAHDVRSVVTIAWPGLEGRQVGLMELRCSDLQSAYFAARERFTRAGIPTIDTEARESFSAELEVQYCARMLVDPEARVPAGRIFKDADEARGRLDADERSYFCTEHEKLQVAKVAAWGATAKGDAGEGGEG